MKVEYGMFKIPPNRRNVKDGKWSNELQTFMQGEQPMMRISFEDEDGGKAAANNCYSALVQLIKRLNAQSQMYCKLRGSVVYTIKKGCVNNGTTEVQD